MDVLKLCIVFAAIVAVLWLKRPLYLAILAGLLVSILVYQIPVLTAASIMGRAAISKGTITVILSLYSITLLQRMLEKRSRLKEAQKALDNLFHSRRLNASLAPAVIGLLPSAGAMTICGAMVEEASQDSLSTEDKAFVTSFFRHVPESFLPTYTSILLALNLSGIPIGKFVAVMIPMVASLFVLGHVFYLRKIPKEIHTGEKADGRKESLRLIRNLWSLAAVVAMILMTDIPVYVATPMVIFVNYFVDRFDWSVFAPMIRTAFEPKIILNTFLVMIFKDIITYTDVVAQLPDLFGSLPIPLPLVFALIFFAGSIISGSTAIISLCIPMAFAAMPGGGVALLMLLMCFSYAAMQISPTHVCLYVAIEYFQVSIGDIVKRTIPVITCFCVICYGYYMLLTVFLH